MSLRKFYLSPFLLLTLLFVSKNTWATFSIIACEQKTKVCAAGVVTNNLAVGASVIYAESGVGAIATQFETNPNYGPRGLALVRDGNSAKDVLSALLKQDNNFDGGSVADRQVAIVTSKKSVASFTGEHAQESMWSGVIEGRNYSVQGNGLVGQNVLDAMQEAFQNGQGNMAERIIDALLAGQNAGGQSTGSMSAAILVKTPAGFPHDIDFRVDNSRQPVKDLDELVNLHYARQLIIKAERIVERHGFDQALSTIKLAISKGKRWDRIWRRAARLAVKHQRNDEALLFLKQFKALNPKWFDIEIEQPQYEAVRNRMGLK